MNSPKLYESKFGGNPYLPLEANHPLDSQGKPMLLMAQINFSDVPSYENMPSQGMLQFLFVELIMKTPAMCTDLNLTILHLKRLSRRFYEDVITDEKVNNRFFVS